MPRIIIAGAAPKNREQLSHLLASSGFSVFRLCASAGELRRTLNACEDAIVILAGALPDLNPDELQWDWGDRLHILLIGKPELLETCEAKEIFRLALPSTGQAVLGAVEMLSQLHQMKQPRRSAAEKDMVAQAKKRLMEKRGIGEEEAHRLLQQYAMNHGMKMAEYAAQIIQNLR